MKKFLLIFWGIIIFLFLGLLFLQFFSVKNVTHIITVPTPTPVSAPEGNHTSFNFSTIFSDPKIADQMSQELQKPQHVVAQGAYTVYSYNLNEKIPVVEVYATTQGPSFILQQATQENSLYTDFLSTHPNQKPIVLNDSQIYDVGYQWQIFPEDGVAFLANAESGFTLKTLYFPSTTQQHFQTTIGKTLSITSPAVSPTPEPFQ